MIQRMNETWRAAGAEAGRGWLRTIDPGQPIAPQVVACAARAAADGAAVGTPWGVVHLSCSWNGVGVACEEGCDAWFDSAIEVVNAALGCNLRFRTLQTMASGEATCARRIWEEEPP